MEKFAMSHMPGGVSSAVIKTLFASVINKPLYEIKVSKGIIYGNISEVLKMYLKFLCKTLHVAFVELHDVFDKMLDRNGVHIICRRDTQHIQPITCLQKSETDFWKIDINLSHFLKYSNSSAMLKKPVRVIF